jgi:hypothetical protein
MGDLHLWQPNNIALNSFPARITWIGGNCWMMLNKRLKLLKRNDKVLIVIEKRACMP